MEGFSFYVTTVSNNLYHAKVRMPLFFLTLQKHFLKRIEFKRKIWSWVRLGTFVSSLCFQLFLDTKGWVSFVFFLSSPSLHIHYTDSTCEQFYSRGEHPAVKQSEITNFQITGSKGWKRSHLSSSAFLQLCVICPGLLLICVHRSAQILLTLTQCRRLAYLDVVRVGESDPSYQCQAVSADSSRGEPAAAAHLDSGAVARWSVLRCKECQTVR